MRGIGYTCKHCGKSLNKNQEVYCSNQCKYLDKRKLNKKEKEYYEKECKK